MHQRPKLQSACLLGLVRGFESNNAFTNHLFANSCRGINLGQQCPTTEWTVTKQQPALAGLTQVGFIISQGC